MPLYKTFHVCPGVRVYVWKIEESEEELAKDILLTSRCQQRVDRMKSELHRRGFLSIRHLLALEGYTDFDLYYDEAGKPHLQDGKYISISHSYTYTCIILGDNKEVGIDIEKQREKIIRIAYKFTTYPVKQHPGPQESLIRDLTYIWGAKESLYKIYATHGLSFLEHIVIDGMPTADHYPKGRIFYEENETSYELKHSEFDGFTCVYAIQD